MIEWLEVTTTNVEIEKWINDNKEFLAENIGDDNKPVIDQTNELEEILELKKLLEEKIEAFNQNYM